MKKPYIHALLCLFVVPFLGFPAGQSTPKSAASSPATPTPPPEPTTQTLTAGLWRVDKGFVSTLDLKNLYDSSPVVVTPTLYTSDGKAIPLPPTTLAANASVSINISQALASNAENLDWGRFGSASVSYVGMAGQVVGSLKMVSAPMSLSYISGLQGLTNKPPEMQTIEGLWWKHDPGVHGFLALSNSTQSVKDVTVVGVSDAGEHTRSQTMTLAPHQTKLLEFAEGETHGVAGGLSVKFSGQLGDVNVLGGLENDLEGYSAMMPFWMQPMPTQASAAAPTTVALTNPGIMVGAADPMMGFPANTTFTPYLALRNTTSNPLPVEVTLSTMDGTNTKLSVPALKPFESRSVDLANLMKGTPLSGFSGMLNLSVSHTGQGTDILQAAGSVDASGTYVFEVPSRGAEVSISKDSPYWTFSGGTDTMVSLWNTGKGDEDLNVEVTDSTGKHTYVFPIHLAPNASYNFSMSQWLMAGKKDATGRSISLGINSGSLRFTSAKGYTTAMELATNVAMFNVGTATCYYGCVSCSSWCCMYFSPGSLNLVTDQYGNMQALAQGPYGTTGVGASWSSSNSQIVITNSPTSLASIYAQQAGSSTITASASEYGPPTYFCQYNPFCWDAPSYTVNLSATGSVTATDDGPVISSVSPSTFAVGSATPTTITGQHFGTNMPQVSTSLGGTVQVTSYSDSQIQATITVANAGTGTVQVTAEGYGGQGFASGSGQPQTSNSQILGVGISLSIQTGPIPVSTGDTSDQIAVSANPSNLTYTPAMSASLTSPGIGSTCNTNLNLTSVTGQGTVYVPVQASGSANCSGVFSVTAAAGGPTATTQVIVPPQIMVQTLVGEAGAQTQPGDATMASLLLVAENRFGDGAFGGFTTFQGVLLAPGQFYGATNNTTTTGVQPELTVAASVFSGETTVNVLNCEGYWSPTNAQFATLQSWANSAANTISDSSWFSAGVAGAPTLWVGTPKQAVIKGSIALNALPSKSASPAIVLFRPAPSPTAAAVIGIP